MYIKIKQKCFSFPQKGVQEHRRAVGPKKVRPFFVKTIYRSYPCWLLLLCQNGWSCETIEDMKMCFPYQFIFVQIKLIFIRRGTTRIRMETEAYFTLWNDVLSILVRIKDYESAFDAATIGNLSKDDGDVYKYNALLKKNITGNSTLGCRNCVDLFSTPNGLKLCSG